MTDAPKLVREFSRSGPCLTLGLWVRDTAKFHVYRKWRGGESYDAQETKVKRRLDDREGYSPAHVEPCPSCRDHAKTQYPHGLMD